MSFTSLLLTRSNLFRQVNENGIVDDPRAQYIGTEPWSANEVIQDETIRLKDILSC